MLLVRRITGNSMLPGYTPGSLIFGMALTRRLKVGQVVIVEHNGMEKIKRIAEIRKGGVYVLGDNPVHSTDSRSFGWLPISSVVARVIWPCSKKTG